MKTSVALTLFAVTVLSFVSLMQVKNDVQKLRSERASLLREQLDMKESIKVLQAEKSYQTRPERLGAYADAMRLQPVTARQVLAMPSGLVEMAYVERR